VDSRTVRYSEARHAELGSQQTGQLSDFLLNRFLNL